MKFIHQYQRRQRYRFWVPSILYVFIFLLFHRLHLSRMRRRSSIPSPGRTQQSMRSWSDLPEDLLSIIAELLGIMELLNFRKACPEFRNAASTATAKIESTPGRPPWLLIFGQTSADYCFLFDQTHKKKYFAYIPELVGSTCLASYKGWLLLSQEQSIFLFCPFSSAKIPLPNFPHVEMKDHIAALSSDPTSDDWVISVINRHDTSTLELNVIGQHERTTWTTHTYTCYPDVGPITGATFHGGIFYFLDDKDTLITFELQDSSWNTFRLVERTQNPNVRGCIPFYSTKQGFSTGAIKGTDVVDGNDIMSWMDLEDDVTVSIRGTSVLTTRGKEWCYHDEQIGRICDEETGSKRRSLKGVWIQPRFHQLSTEFASLSLS